MWQRRPHLTAAIGIALREPPEVRLRLLEAHAIGATRQIHVVEPPDEAPLIIDVTRTIPGPSQPEWVHHGIGYSPEMHDTNALFDELLAAYRNADDPDRFLREFLMRLDDATTNAVVATERKLDRLDAARARLDAARQIPRPDTSEDGDDDKEHVGDAAQEQDDDQDVEQAENPPKPKKRKAKTPASGSDGP
jgi:hypothetical protein